MKCTLLWKGSNFSLRASTQYPILKRWGKLKVKNGVRRKCVYFPRENQWSVKKMGKAIRNMFSCFEDLFLFTLETTIRENSVNCFKVYVSKLKSRNLKHKSFFQLFQPLLHDVFIINLKQWDGFKLTSACFDRQYSNNCKLSGSILWCLFPIQSVALYILGDESALSNEASHYLYKITSGKDALMPP